MPFLPPRTMRELYVWTNGRKREKEWNDGEIIVKHKSLKTAVKRKKLTDWKSQAFNALEASTVLWISPITCLARLIKTASAVPSNPEKLMRNDYLLLETMKFYLVETFIFFIVFFCRRLNVNIENWKFYFEHYFFLHIDYSNPESYHVNLFLI